MTAGGFDQIHDELRAVARDILGKAGTPARPGWRLLAEAGWLGLEVPGTLEGAEATFAETAVILTELGRAAACGPYLGAAVLGVGALRQLVPSPDRDELLRRTASGEAVPVAVLADGARDDVPDAPATARETAGGGLTPESVAPFRVEWAAGGPRLYGRAAFAPDAAEASHLLLLATDPDNSKRLVLVGMDAGPRGAGVRVEAQPVLDATRRLALVIADGAEVPETSVHRFAGDPEVAVRGLLDRAAVAVACDSLGVSEAMLDATVAYVKVREQFGHPVGSFQAVQHACADMLVRVSVARELVDAAVRAVAVAPGHPETAVAASMAKAYASAAAVDVTGKAMQLHGGIGYTWEGGIHAYLKRATLNRSLSGSPAAHRRRIAARYR
jgi:alkylation response protein AidB-like acyl-CoA dehydrogenase